MHERSEHLKSLGESAATKYNYDHPDFEVLERFPNPMPDNESISRSSLIQITQPEFTSLCPKTGQPDFAKILISYAPNKWCVESKSLKLYLMGYRNHGAFHEECVNQIGEDLVKLLDPAYLAVTGEFTPRGGIPFWPTFAYGNPAGKVILDPIPTVYPHGVQVEEFETRGGVEPN